MIEASEQYERAEDAVTRLKRCWLAARRPHTAEAHAALSAPILRELQERGCDILLYLSQSPAVSAESQAC
jgi:hypothetical protein